MKISHASLLGVMLTGAIAFSASAADLKSSGGGYKDGPVYAAVDWSGWYAGVNAGGGGTSSDGLVSPSGGFGGGQIGYNWQGAFGLGRNWVVGVEADIQGSGIDDSVDGLKSSLNWFGTVRGRAGYSFGPTLVYATGGLAFGEVENCCFKRGASATDTQTGYVVGGGVEYRFSPVWSIKGEYQFISLDAGGSAPGTLGFVSGNRSEIDTFRVGVNYHFGRGWDPLK
jgi:outer membrane immunogenic protein